MVTDRYHRRMIRNLLLVGACFVLCNACGSDSAGSENTGKTCPDVSGTWQVTEHCVASLVGASASVKQTGCELSFDAPFDGFSGSVTSDGKITIGGVQDCVGNATSSAISMLCTPGDCQVKLAR